MRFPLTVGAAFVAAAMAIPAAHAESVSTRYGTLSTADRNSMLLLNGKPFSPPVEADGHFHFAKFFQTPDADIVVLADGGFSAFDADYRVLTLSQQGVKVTSTFGTGAEATAISMQGDAVVVTMPGYIGHGATPAQRDRVQREVHVLKVTGSIITDNGKPTKTY